MINPEIKEKMCKDFYPNCRYCNCFSMCFPKNESEDVSSQAFLEQEKRFKESLMVYKPLAGLEGSSP